MQEKKRALVTPMGETYLGKGGEKNKAQATKGALG